MGWDGAGFSSDDLKGAFSEDAWGDVLRSVEKTYQELVAHQVALEEQNRELEQLRTFLTSILGSMSDVLVVCGPEGQVLEVNAALLSLLGRGRDEVLGLQAAALFAEADRDGLRADLVALRTRGGACTAERRLQARGGATPLELSATARRDERGRFRGAVLMGRPLGELRRAYDELAASHEALKEAQSQLVHSEKLASLGRLLAGVAHELNNPISFVYGNAHALSRYADKFVAYFERVEAGASREELVALRRELRLDKAIRNLRSAVAGAVEGAERTRDIVESLRRLSASGSGEAEAFDLCETARTGAHWVIRGRARAVAVATDMPAPVPARGRPGQIQQVVMNLVQNALDAMDGCVRQELTLRAYAAGAHAVLEVGDRGCGIPPGVAMRLFDPFYTTKPVGEGTGLGLSISYKIVEEDGGTLAFENREGGGALFRLTLPSSTDG